MKRVIYLLTLLLISSCTKYYEMDIPEGTQRLVFEGVLTNLDQSCSFRLSKTTKYKFRFDSAQYLSERDALLIISDESGNCDTLIEYIDGMYKTNPKKLKGIVGKTYKIDIYTKDGKHYVSIGEKMESVPQIDSLYYEHDYSNRPKNSPDLYSNKVFVDWQDPKGYPNYLMNYVTYKVGETWKDNIRWCSIINDFNFDGKYMNKIHLFTDYANSSYKIRVTFYSLTKKNFDYWNVLFQQKDPNEDADVNATVPLIGNIYNADDPKDYVLGYFQVSAACVREKKIE